MRLVRDDARAFEMMREAGYGVWPLSAGWVRLDGLGCVVFHHFDRVDIEISVINRGPVSRGILRSIWHIAFEGNGAQRVTARCHAGHRTSRKLLLRMGFKEEGVRRRAAPDGGDVVFYGLLKEDIHGTATGTA